MVSSSRVLPLYKLTLQPEEIHRYAGNLVREKLDKEKKQKAIQTNIEEFDQGIADRLLDEELEKRASSWFTKPLTEVLLPTDWTLLESLKNIRETKGKLTDLAKVREKKRVNAIQEEFKKYHKPETA